MSSGTISKYFSGKSAPKRKPSSTSSASDTCSSPKNNDANKPKQDRKKQKQGSLGVSEENRMEAALRDIRQQLNSLATKDDIKQLKEEMSRIVARLDAKIEKLEGEVFELKQENDSLTREVTTLKEENKEMQNQMEQCRKEGRAMRRDINDHEQHGRQFNLRLYGVPEVQGGTETVEDCVRKCTDIFTSKVGVRVTKEDIEIAHRVGKTGGARPRPILTRFFSRRLRGNVLTDRRKLKQSGVSISEDLTLANYKLLRSANEHSATMAAWSSNGKILAKVKNGQTVRLDIDSNVDEELVRAMR